MKGQMMLITAVLVSLIMLGTGAAVANIGSNEYHFIEEGYLAQMIKEETRQLDMTYRKNRENYRKMIGFMEEYETSTSYNDIQRCYNVTLRSEGSTVRMECIG
ncbi:MAG: hypothetical protein ABEK10_02320 [Candidatus Nanosalina sp.]